MGEVYRAWDPRLEREVALKILRERPGTDTLRLQRFIAEARAASGLNHPNILTVFDAAVGDDGATPYLVSELIDGESLRDVIRRGPVPLKRLLDLATQIADGLSDAHAAGIVHRDLKPENIMVTRGGRAKILDFGLARAIEAADPGSLPAEVSTQTVTAPGLLSGTVPYMSPEQARGLRTDFHSDQFSFGLVLYEMATGTQPFRRAAPAETLDAIVNAEAPPAASLNPQLPLLLTWVIERCLAKNPDERYGVTADLHRDLRTLRDRLGEALARDGAGAPAAAAPSLARRVLRGAAVVALIAGAALIGRGLQPAEPIDLTAALFAPLATETAYEGSPAWSPADPETIAYVAEAGGTLQVFTRRRNAAAAAQVTNSAYDCKHPFWSPDGRRIFYVSLGRDREGIWSVPAAGGAAQLVVENATAGAISPDGATIAFTRDSEERPDVVGTAAIWLTKADGLGKPARYDRAPFNELRIGEASLAFSPDGRWLAAAIIPETIALEESRRGWQFWLLPTGDGMPSRRFAWWTNVMPRLTPFSWMPDSRHVVIGITSLDTTNSQLWLADVRGDRAWPLTRGPLRSYQPSVSPSGEDIVFASDEPEYDLVELPTSGGPPRPFIATSRNESDPVWSPAAKAYAYVTDRAGQTEIWLKTGDGPLGDRPLITRGNFKDVNMMLAAPAFSPDGLRIAYQRNATAPIWPLRIWYSPVAGGAPVPVLPETHRSYQGAPTWSPDNQWLAFAEWTGSEWKLVKVRVAGANEAVTLRTDGVASAAPRWSPDGEWITWQDAEGLLIVAASDGRRQKRVSGDGWLAHAWSFDGKEIYAIRETDDLHLALVAVDVATGREKILSDLGASPPVNNQVKGLSLGPDGRTLVTGIARMRGDIWLLQGIRAPKTWLQRLRLASP
jgi:Tol biopolymer transport system component/tRNA A-37 threonylcarbamoyl transferase component Bud32